MQRLSEKYPVARENNTQIIVEKRGLKPDKIFLLKNIFQLYINTK